MAKKLTKLRVDSVDVVDRGAGEGVQIRLIKRAGGDQRWTGHWDGAYGLVRRRHRQAKRVDDVDASNSVARARTEIAENLRAVGPRVETVKHQLGDDEMEQIDVAKAMDTAVARVMKADPSIRSTASAMLKLAESRDPTDQALWRAFKENTAPASAPIEKTVNVEKAVRKMVARVSELEEGGLSRAAALLKIASDPAHHKTWMQWRATGANLDEVMKAAGGNQFSDGSYAFSELCRSLAASYPQLSSGQIRQLARQIQQHKAPLDALAGRLGYRGAA